MLLLHFPNKRKNLASAASGMPENETGNSETAYSVAYDNVPPKSVAQPCGQDYYSPKRTHLVEAVAEFAKIVKPIMVIENKNDDDTNEDHDSALATAVKRIHEASTIDESVKYTNDETSQFILDYKECMVKKVRSIMR